MEKIVKNLHSPWFTICLAIALGVVVYTTVLAKEGKLSAMAGYCPVVACDGERCDKTPGCEHGNCNGECPGNC